MKNSILSSLFSLFCMYHTLHAVLVRMPNEEALKMQLASDSRWEKKLQEKIARELGGKELEPQEIARIIHTTFMAYNSWQAIKLGTDSSQPADQATMVLTRVVLQHAVSVHDDNQPGDSDFA